MHRSCKGREGSGAIPCKNQLSFITHEQRVANERKYASVNEKVTSQRMAGDVGSSPVSRHTRNAFSAQVIKPSSVSDGCVLGDAFGRRRAARETGMQNEIASEIWEVPPYVQPRPTASKTPWTWKLRLEGPMDQNKRGNSGASNMSKVMPHLSRKGYFYSVLSSSRYHTDYLGRIGHSKTNGGKTGVEPLYRKNPCPGHLGHGRTPLDVEKGGGE